MYNNQEISSLSREELRKALQKFQLKAGPITHTTRRIFENRLKAHLEKCNAEVESKEDKENWIVIDNKCYHGYNGKHENVKSDENNGDGIIHSNNYDNHIVNTKKSCEKNYVPELTIVKNESYNSVEHFVEKIPNGDIERTNYGDNSTGTVINVGPVKNHDSNHIEVKISNVTYERDDSKTPNGNFDLAGSNYKLVIVENGVTNHINNDSSDVVNHIEASLDNVHISNNVSHTCVLDNVKNKEVNFTHNAVLLDNVQGSEIDVTHDAVVLNSIQTSEANVINDAVTLNCNQTSKIGTSFDDNSTVTTLTNETASSSLQTSSTEMTGITSEVASTETNSLSSETKSSAVESTETKCTGGIITETECTVIPPPEEIQRAPCYYAVWIPHSSARVNGNKPIICESQQEALQKMKGFKGSRFKMFELKAEAENFSLSKTMHSIIEKPIPQIVPAPNQNQSEPKEKILKVPTFHEIIKFRQHIEKFKTDEIETCLVNPRYLISASDIPVILQEGSRMNAVHIATKCNRVKVLKILFNHLQSDEFLGMVYSSMPDSHIEFRRNHLLDLYLNTPEKILCDTPLHMACKFGFTNIVKYLLTFKQLKVNAQNTDRKTSVEVICDRLYARSTADRDKIKSEILSLFEEKAYVPLYDDECGMQSKIGRPIVSISPNEIYTSQIKVKAYAGPMSPEQASNVFEKWKKSPRDRLNCMIARSDYEKGMERIGRSIASNANVPFTEYWSFLDKYTNLTTTQGLKKLEKYLKSKYTASIQNCKKENCTSASTTKKYNKNKNNRRSIEGSLENGKQPIDIKRKLTFDEAKPKAKNNKNKHENNKNTGVLSNNHSNPDNTLVEQNTVTANQGTPVSDQSEVVSSENALNSDQCTHDSNKKTVLDEKVSDVPGTGSLCVEVQKDADSIRETHDKMENIPKNNPSESLQSENFVTDTIEKDSTNCLHKNTESNSFCNDGNVDNNNRVNEESTKEEVNEDGDEKDTALRCSPLQCLCDDRISEECYLSEAFNQLHINFEVTEESRASHLSDDGNVDMDLVNQSVSFHLESGKVLEDGILDETLCDNFDKLEIDSDKNINNTSNDTCSNSNTKVENLSQSSVGNPVPSSASFISPIPSLSVFDSPKLPSSFNSPTPSLSSFENKMSIPGIINLPGKVDNSTDQNNCYPEQHAVFIDGDQPSKHDLDVLRALGESIAIDNYPHIRRWKCLVESFSDDIKSSWPSPGSPRYTKTLRRRTLWSA